MTASVTCATDEDSRRRAITDTYDYDAFGNKINSTGTTPNNFLYRGEEYDPDLGLYYLRARYYNPLTGRFMSRIRRTRSPWTQPERPSIRRSCTSTCMRAVIRST